MNWDDLRFLLALGREGSLAAAARALGVDQTTVARRLRALEQSLGGALFTRAGAGNGWSPTAMGERVLERCTRIEADVAGLVHLAESERQAVQGLVRITTVDLLASAFLLPHLPALRRLHPALEIELVTANENLGVGRSETDIALRLARPEDGDLRIRRLAELGFACYRSREGGDDAWLSYDAGLAHTPEMRWLARQPGAATSVALRSNNAAVLAGAAAQGLGRALLPCCVGDAWPGLKRTSGTQPVLLREVWMLLHRDARAHPRIAATADWLAARFADGAGLLRNGEGARAKGYGLLAGE